MSYENNVHFMKLALELARKGLGRTKTNPCVGCIIVKNGKVVGKGFHEKFGKAHAEVNAITSAGKKAKNATLYVTLEPCVQFKGKKTNECVSAIEKAGINKVVIGMKDVNPKVKGKGIQKLKKAGIQVTVGVLENECMEVNKAYRKWITSGLPYVVQKIGMSADGIIWSKENNGKWITGKESQKQTHLLRNQLDAILVGIKTVVHDNPKLTCRLRGGRNPVRIILDELLEIPITAHALTGKGNIILIIGKRLDKKQKKKKQLLEKKYKNKIMFISLKAKNGEFNLKQVMRVLGEQGIASVLIEGGQMLNTSLLKEKIADEVHFFIAPKIFSTGLTYVQLKEEKNAHVNIQSIQPVGKDLHIICTQA